MIRNNILYTLFIPNLQVELLEQENPSDKPSLGILLGERLLQIQMVFEDYDAKNLYKA